PDLVREDKRGLVLAIQIAAELQGGNALHRVGEDADRRHQIYERHLAAGEDRAGRNRELVRALTALELTTGADAVGIQTATARADRRAVRLMPAHALERLVSRFLASLVDF